MKKHLFLILVTAMMAVTSTFAQTRELQIYKGGSLIQSFPITNIDSVKVGYAFSAPASVTAQLTGKSIVVSWSAVSGAKSYQLYRSADNKNFSLLAGNLTTTSYTDNVPLSGTNYYKVKAFGDGTESAMSISTGTATKPSSGMESGLYLGVMGFNQALTSKPISILKSETKSAYDSFIDDLPIKNGTVLCYSVDQAINALQSATLPDDVFSAAIVTFTDGLDQGSVMLDDRYVSDDDFLAAIHQRIANESVAGLPISAYSIGLRGSDVTSADDIAKFKTTLKQLASTDANATEVASMSEVKSKFQEIAEQLNSSSYLQTISLTIPGLSNGTRVRFTFDNVSSAANSKVYIEGTFNLRSYSLTDVVYKGMTSTTGSTIAGTKDGIFVTFKIDGIQTDNGKLLSSDYIDEWYLTSANIWQINSEFDKDENSDVVYEKKSAVIMLVLDCSISLGNQFGTMKTNAKSFVSTLSQPSGGGDTPGYDNFGTAIDLGLSVKWANMNVGASKPEDYGDYFAWGETTPKTTYDQENYKWYDSGFTKYNETDGMTTLELSDDAAHANWGGTWRMPTVKELEELNTSCSWTWTTQNDVNGYLVTGPNGNSIFFPAAGYLKDESLIRVNSYGYYLSSLRFTSPAAQSVLFFFTSGKHKTNSNTTDYSVVTDFNNNVYVRYHGFSVRPVTE